MRSKFIWLCSLVVERATYNRLMKGQNLLEPPNVKLLTKLVAYPERSVIVALHIWDVAEPCKSDVLDQNLIFYKIYDIIIIENEKER